ncbi:hypothetical protein M0208_14405 [Sphingomonas sp. SUN019]|uniref:NepR family anti-sigma factor n=1 Tax=Sphingomonas sp. SUN019 TaxID=2937788 RepID=UPI002164C996|nr:NepR family anti-sigma factor [Sphingomonas sp. SUN019]UVO51639.1 hypothetical protein M0208_14405 [Sphingomonas sp. SUN019]
MSPFSNTAAMCAPGPDLSMRFRRFSRTIDRNSAIDEFPRRTVEPSTRSFVSLSRLHVAHAGSPAVSGRIQGPPGNDPGFAGGFVLSSGHEEKKSDRKKGVPPVQSKDRDMGSALRSIYQKTIEEAVPDEMLSLLGKLD